MGLGLIFLMIADHRRKASALNLQTNETHPVSTEAERRPSALAVARIPARQHEGDTSEHDEWRSLVEGDQDLSRTVTILSAYGQKYVVVREELPSG